MRKIDLKEIRMERGLLQREVAEKSNISQSFYCRIEQGSRKPSLKTANKITYILGITLDEFYKAISQGGRK